MGNLFYTIAVILIIIWAIGYLGGFMPGGLIHIFIGDCFNCGYLKDHSSKKTFVKDRYYNEDCFFMAIYYQ